MEKGEHFVEGDLVLTLEVVGRQFATGVRFLQKRVTGSDSGLYCMSRTQNERLKHTAASSCVRGVRNWRLTLIGRRNIPHENLGDLRFAFAVCS